MNKHADLMREAADKLDQAGLPCQGLVEDLLDAADEIERQEPVAYLQKDQLRQIKRRGPAVGYIGTGPRIDCLPVYASTKHVSPDETTEPFAWATFDGEGGYELRLFEENEDYRDKWLSLNPGPTYRDWVRPLYTAPQPAEQHPDAAQLVEALEDIAQWSERWAAPGHPVATIARKALAAYQQGGET